MNHYYDDLEVRDAAARAAALEMDLPVQIACARGLPGYAESLADVDPKAITSVAALADLPVLRKSDLVALQKADPPFGGLITLDVAHLDFVFQSPGPIYEPGSRAKDWWRMARFLRAAGIASHDIVQNCFGYHMTPGGQMFESGAAALGATVFPAGTGQTALQAEAAVAIGATAYAGTPDYLRTILEAGDAAGLTLGFKKAVVSGGALFPSLRAYYADRGIACLQCYATADVGLIAYESPAMDGMIVDERVIVEIVTPGTGDPVPEGEVGEVLVTALNPDYPLIRFATGDLSAVLPGQSPCGRTNMRIKGWMGRADQTTKVKGMFVRPEQVADLVRKHAGAEKVRIVVDRDGGQDRITVRVEANDLDPEAFAVSVRDSLKLNGIIEVTAPGTLPRDGVVIEDARDYETG